MDQYTSFYSYFSSRVMEAILLKKTERVQRSVSSYEVLWNFNDLQRDVCWFSIIHHHRSVFLGTFSSSHLFEKKITIESISDPLSSENSSQNRKRRLKESVVIVQTQTHPAIVRWREFRFGVVSASFLVFCMIKSSTSIYWF